MDSIRYSRQMLFSPIGPSGQEMLANKKVAIVGLGALGTVLANHLVRAGVGHVRMIDRDFVEASNLQRQILYDEADARDHLPKAIAAANKLQAINSSIIVEGIIADLHAGNAQSLLADVDLILDGSDNFQVRYLINDVAIRYDIPWVYGGAVHSRGMFAVIRPGVTPCLRCLFPHAPVGQGETCDTIGVIGPLVSIIASYQATEAIKLLVGDLGHLNPYLEQLDVWQNDHDQLSITKGRNPDCPVCVRGEFDFLANMEGTTEDFAALCGRDTVQIRPVHPENVDLSLLAKRFELLGTVEHYRFLLRFYVDGHTLVFFQDGRVLVQGTDDLTIARTLYAKYVGH